MGKSLGGGSLCGPVFDEFMTAAISKYGGRDFTVPDGGKFINMDRYTGGQLPDDAKGENVVAEFFRDGEEPEFGITFDGGFSIGSNLFRDDSSIEEVQVIIKDGEETREVPSTATIGTVSSGGLY